jgi:hypothetical protein
MLLDPPGANLSFSARNSLARYLYIRLREDMHEFWDASDKDPERLVIKTIYKFGHGWIMSLELYVEKGQWLVVFTGHPRATEDDAMDGLKCGADALSKV